MTDTIDLLESVGKDASLRHAGTAELAVAMAGMHANAALQQAMASGDMAPLHMELGTRPMFSLDSPIQTGFEDEPDVGELLPDDSGPNDADDGD